MVNQRFFIYCSLATSNVIEQGKQSLCKVYFELYGGILVGTKILEGGVRLQTLHCHRLNKSAVRLECCE